MILIDVLVVPELPHFLILGVDFWRRCSIVPFAGRSVVLYRSSERALFDTGRRRGKRLERRGKNSVEGSGEQECRTDGK